jgi:diguanylate cyclase (GGDEF)-like protein
MAGPFEFFAAAFWTGWRRWAAWTICIGAIILLGALRTATDAELAFASLALLPVLAIAWIGGLRHGLVMACTAAAILAAGEITSGRQFSAAWIPWVNAVTRLTIFSLMAFLLAEVRLQFETVRERANVDALTGLQNRRAFLEAGASEVERAKRYTHPLAVIFLDLDDFKRLNDTRGHDVGDAALRETARALRNTLRSSDRVARLGGDEFAALLPEIGYDAAVDAGDKISMAVNGALRDFSPVTASLGLAWFEEVDREFSAMLKIADDLMYDAKASGKNAMRSRSFSASEKPFSRE